jgi:hypothetical protein
VIAKGTFCLRRRWGWVPFWGSLVHRKRRGKSRFRQTTNTVAIQASRTIYATDGQPIGQVMIHARSHITFSDANGNGQPDPGEITASVDHFRFTCH